MERIEDKVKALIQERYDSMNKFCEKIDMSWTTLDSILKRGFCKANVINVLKITNELNIDTEALAKGTLKFKGIAKHDTLEKTPWAEAIDIMELYVQLNEDGRAKALEFVSLLLLDPANKKGATFEALDATKNAG